VDGPPQLFWWRVWLPLRNTLQCTKLDIASVFCSVLWNWTPQLLKRGCALGSVWSCQWRTFLCRSWLLDPRVVGKRTESVVSVETLYVIVAADVVEESVDGHLWSVLKYNAIAVALNAPCPVCISRILERPDHFSNIVADREFSTSCYLFYSFQFRSAFLY